MMQKKLGTAVLEDLKFKSHYTLVGILGKSKIIILVETIAEST